MTTPYTVSDRILEKLKMLTPSFVKRNKNLTAIYNSVALILSDFYYAMVALITSNWVGKGLRLFADKCQIFYNYEDTDTSIQLRVMEKYNINQARGTASQIPLDLSALLMGDISLNLTYADKRGWILGLTYPGIDYVFIDSPKLIVIEDEYYPIAGEIPDIIRQLDVIKRKIIPIDTDIIRVQV
jgi:hypothetical protein